MIDFVSFAHMTWKLNGQNDQNKLCLHILTLCFIPYIPPATEYHLGLLKAKLAKYRAQLLEPSKSAGAKGEGFDVMKSGDARVALIGFPSVGKVRQHGLGILVTSLRCLPKHTFSPYDSLKNTKTLSNTDRSINLNVLILIVIILIVIYSIFLNIKQIIFFKRAVLTICKLKSLFYDFVFQHIYFLTV